MKRSYLNNHWNAECKEVKSQFPGNARLSRAWLESIRHSWTEEGLLCFRRSLGSCYCCCSLALQSALCTLCTALLLQQRANAKERTPLTPLIRNGVFKKGVVTMKWSMNYEMLLDYNYLHCTEYSLKFEKYISKLKS